MREDIRISKETQLAEVIHLHLFRRFGLKVSRLVPGNRRNFFLHRYHSPCENTFPLGAVHTQRQTSKETVCSSPF